VSAVAPRLAATVLYVEDVGRALAFYESAVGLRRRYTDDRGVYADLDTGDTVLALTARRSAEHESCPRAESGAAGAPAPVEIAIEVDDVAGAVERAIEFGAELVRAPEMKYWGQTIGFVRDPDGHVIQFCSPLPAPFGPGVATAP
jgi:catechol 2,3-dioxygenase-like lactoylglutathione lyase family enzyme